MNRKIISEILTAKWNINGDYAQAHLPLLIALLNGSTAVSFVQRSGNEAVEQPFAIDPKTMDRLDLYAYDSSRGQVVPNPNIPEGSVGIVPISGPLYYYNGDCGEPGMMQRTNWLQDMGKRSNIGSIVQLIDTPGGSTAASPGYLAAMNRTGKPILSLVDNMCASLGLWFSSQSQETYLSHEFAEMGSCGSYAMLVDSTGALEQKGYKIVQIYAPQSVDKNKAMNDALNGDQTLMKEDLRVHVDAFIKHINNTRGDKAKANESAWNSGKMFYAADAKKIGLADGVAQLDYVVGKAAWLGKRNK